MLCEAFEYLRTLPSGRSATDGRGPSTVDKTAAADISLAPENRGGARPSRQVEMSLSTAIIILLYNCTNLSLGSYS